MSSRYQRALSEAWLGNVGGFIVMAVAVTYGYSKLEDYLVSDKKASAPVAQTAASAASSSALVPTLTASQPR